MRALDGKHIRTSKPNDSSSQLFNYKNLFSTVLMAVADTDWCFISVEVGTSKATNFHNCIGRVHPVVLNYTIILIMNTVYQDRYS
jgi:hypothetical protein